MLNTIQATALVFQSRAKREVRTLDQSDRQTDTARAMLVPSESSQPDTAASNSISQYRIPIVAAQILILLCFGALIKRGIDYLRSMSIWKYIEESLQ